MLVYHISGTFSSSHQEGSRANCVGAMYANSQSMTATMSSASFKRTLLGRRSSHQSLKELDPLGAGDSVEVWLLDWADQSSSTNPKVDSRPCLANLRKSWRATYLFRQLSAVVTRSLC